MEVTFYWFAWSLTVIAIFFIQRRKLKRDLLLVLGVLMCTYDMLSWSQKGQVYFHVFILIFFGTYLFITIRRAWFDYFWPFIFSIGYAAVWMFLIVHPVWVNFPGISLFLLLIVGLLRVFIKDVGGQMGLWMLTNAGGTFFSFLIFSLYQNEGLIDTHVMLSLSIKGVFVLLLFHGVGQLKRSIRKKRKSISKGAAFV
ncbi:YphA family membrane protein [Halobacillus faecis]